MHRSWGGACSRPMNLVSLVSIALAFSLLVSIPAANAASYQRLGVARNAAAFPTPAATKKTASPPTHHGRRGEPTNKAQSSRSSAYRRRAPNPSSAQTASPVQPFDLESLTKAPKLSLTRFTCPERVSAKQYFNNARNVVQEALGGRSVGGQKKREDQSSHAYRID